MLLSPLSKSRNKLIASASAEVVVDLKMDREVMPSTDDLERSGEGMGCCRG